MDCSRLTKRFNRKLERLQFVRKSIHAIYLWPLLCLALGGVLWIATLSRIADDRAHLLQHAERESDQILKAYSQQIGRSIDQIDQLILLVRYSWRQTGGNLSLEDQLREGLFPAASHLYVTISDANGNLLSSTINNKKRFNIADRDYFVFHRNSVSDRLLISKPSVGRRSGRNVIRFTRSITGADGKFAGLVMVGVEPDWLASFSEESTLGSRDFLILRHETHGMLVARIGEHHAEAYASFREPPMMAVENAVLRMPAERFVDNEARIVGWRGIEGHPLVAVVGRSESELLAAFETTARHYRNIAAAGSALLLLMAMTGVFFSIRLAWRKHQTDEVRKTYHLATDAAREGFYMVRPVFDRKNGEAIDFQVEDCNERGAWYYNRTRADLIGKPFSTVFPAGLYREQVLALFRKALANGFYEDEFKVPAISPLRSGWIQRRLVRSGSGLAVTLRDISEMKAHEGAMSRLVNLDTLTALPNRHWLMEQLPAVLARAEGENKILAVLFVDLDNFKDINDTSGHHAGDEVLREAAARLKKVLRPTDKVIRLGGDEFTIVLDGIAGLDEVVEIAAAINRVFREPFDSCQRHAAVSASIGISLFPQDGKDVETLLKNADIAMYAAKADGKGTSRFYDQALYQRIRYRLDTEQELKAALEADQFVIHYQPRINTGSGELAGMEALVRWEHPTRGLVMPNEFISLAESSGQILALGELVMDKVCVQIAQWKAGGLPIVPVSVNVSPRQINDGTVAILISSCLERHGIGPQWLEIELTESSMMGESDNIVSEMAAIRALGIRIHIDDFGTGYSSLALLHRLEAEVLKVDRSFVSQLGIGGEGEVFFKAIMSIARALGMSVIAEGVETLAQLKILQALSCDEIQGYLVSRPVPAEEVPALMEKRYLLP